MLSHQRPVALDYSEESARTVEVIREENDHGELGSFGFTLLYEKPSIIGSIVPGESATSVLSMSVVLASCWVVLPTE